VRGYSEALRAFLAIPAPAEVIERIGLLREKLSEVLDGVAWVRAESLHLTVRFFGNVPGGQVAELQELIRQVCSHFPSFVVRVAGAGGFGGRVIWVGVSDAAGRLQELADRINEGARGFGGHEETRAFRPHLTIGRVKKEYVGRVSFAEKLKSWKETEFGEWTVDHLDLMRSELLPQGARHTCLARIPLLGKDVQDGRSR